jgi:integrase
MQQRLSKPVPSHHWQCPIDVARYDQTAALRPEEYAELEFIRGCKHGWPRQTYIVLERFLRPIREVIAFAGYPTRNTLHILTTQHFFREMYRRGTSWWAWSHEEWLETIDRAGPGCKQGVIALGYLLCDVVDAQILRNVPHHRRAMAYKVLGQEPVDATLDRVLSICRKWGYAQSNEQHLVPLVCSALWLAQSPLLEDLTSETLIALATHHRALTRTVYPKALDMITLLSRVLVDCGIIPTVLSFSVEPSSDAAKEGVHPMWLSWCQRWRDHAANALRTKRHVYYTLLLVGRWLAHHHPDITSPEQWTAELAVEFVAAVDQMKVGEWRAVHKHHPMNKPGNPLRPRSKAGILSGIRLFLRDCQEWGWIPVRFSPVRYLRTPRSIRTLIGPDPRVIETEWWAKILWAALNLTAEDLPHTLMNTINYPVEMVRALAIVWCFAGLRSDEIYRLRLGSARWQREDITLKETGETLPKDAICWLDIPVSKTMTAQSRPVHPHVGKAIEEWERLRPAQPKSVDPKTNETVQYLFMYRGKRVGKTYLNARLIPMLCRKAGVPESDARGRITSHRARATIASLLYNAKNPVSLFQLQEFLGHRNLSSTQHYAKVSSTKLAKAYVDTGYLETLTHTVKVLIDQDVIMNGAAASSEMWKYYDLGHGYCTFTFFEQCRYRMASARCSYYLPKTSSQAQLLEGKANLLRMQQEIPLTEEERAAVEDGVEAFERLLQKLEGVPTPAEASSSEAKVRGRSLPVLPTRTLNKPMRKEESK